MTQCLHCPVALILKMRKRLKSISMNLRNISRIIIYAKESTSLWRNLDPLHKSRSNSDMKELTMTCLTRGMLLAEQKV